MMDHREPQLTERFSTNDHLTPLGLFESWVIAHFIQTYFALWKKVEHVVLQLTAALQSKRTTLKDKLDQMEYTFDKKRAQKWRCLSAARVKWEKRLRHTYTETGRPLMQPEGPSARQVHLQRNGPNSRRITQKS